MPFLQRSPLQAVLRLDAPSTARGKALHQTLIDAVEQVKPPYEVSPDAVGWKLYRSLVLRYVRSLNATTAASELGLSTRQAQRIHAIALTSVSAILWESRRSDTELEETPPKLGGVVGIADDFDSVETLDQELDAILAGAPRDLEPFPATLRGVLATLDPVFKQRSVSVDLTIDQELAHRIGPHGLLRQAFVQLLLAAVEYTSSSHVRISATHQPRGATVDVTVTPNDGDDVRSRPNDRRLRVAERLLGAIQGTLAVETGPDLRIASVLTLGVSPTVLVVEDNPQVVNLFRRYLAGSIFRLVHAADADSAIDLIASERPSVVTLDVMMPRRDGWELLQALKVRSDTQNIPVLICSVLRDHELASALGASGFLPKPISQHALLEALGRFAPLPSPGIPGPAVARPQTR